MNGHRSIPLLAVLFVYLLFFSPQCNSLEDGAGMEMRNSSSPSMDEEELAVQRWVHTFAKVKKLIGTGIKTAMPYFMSSMSDKDLQLSQQCQRALFQWISDLRATKPWSLMMADASGKMINGILTGTLQSFGAFDQCLDIQNPKGNIHGKYCTVQAWPKLPPKPRFYALNQRLKAFERFENDTGMLGEFTKYVQLFYMFPMRFGVCVPSPCSREDISNLTHQITKKVFKVNITVPICQVKEPYRIENYQIPMICVIVILLVLVIIGTVYDIFVFSKKTLGPSEDPGVLSDCLMAFSASSNWDKLTDLEAGEDNLSVLHGLRFFSMCWVILGHTYFHLNFNILRHLQITIELTSQFIFNTVTNATLVVDNFFFLSGLLFVYVTMDMMKVIGKIPRPIYFVIHRIWRFFPIMMFFVGCSTLLPLLGDGPTWHENIDPIVEGCRTDWWANMIFINNLYRTSNQGCLSFSWYLAADFQIYIFCIPIVILIIRKPRVGLWVNFVVMILSIIAIAVHNYVRDLPPTMLFTRADVDQRSDLMKETYYTPYRHVGPSCIGMFAGYYLQTYKKPIQMHWSLHVLAWIGSFTLTSAALFGVHPWNKGYGATGMVPTVLYASLARMAWTVGVAWITIACTIGHGGILGRILKCKTLVPFSRLTFLVYMVHPFVQHVFYATLREGIQALNHLAIFICFGFIVSSYGIAFFLSILLESPFINLGKIIFKRREFNKKQKRLRMSAKKDADSDVAKSQSKWTNGTVPQLAIRNGKCNGAYESQQETNNSSVIERNGNHKGDFICHL